MNKELLPHQIEDAKFLASKSFAGNFSGMGSGKTLTALKACDLVKSWRKYNNVIIIGPPISLPMWKAEAEANLPGEEGSYWPTQAQILKTGTTKIDKNADVIIMSYEIATKRVAELKALKACVLICDESHALKSIKAKRTKAILGRDGLTSYVKHTWLLTGTPVTRWNDDLYSFLCRADLPGVKERCGGDSMERFRLQYCVTQRKHWPGASFPTIVTVGSRNTDKLNEWVFDGGLAVRRDLADVWKAMPPFTSNRLPVSQTRDPELAAMMKMLDRRTLKQIEEALGSNDEHIATMRRWLGLSKVAAAADLIADRIESGSGPLLVGVWHRDVIDKLVTELQKRDISQRVIDGRTSAAQKQSAQELFNAKEIDVLLAQIASCGVSLNLQHGGNRIVVVEEDFSPAVMDQFYARLLRMGQEKHVHADILVTDTKLDKAIAQISSRKRSEHGILLKQEEAA